MNISFIHTVTSFTIWELSPRLTKGIRSGVNGSWAVERLKCHSINNLTNQIESSSLWVVFISFTFNQDKPVTAQTIIRSFLCFCIYCHHHHHHLQTKSSKNKRGSSRCKFLLWFPDENVSFYIEAFVSGYFTSMIVNRKMDEAVITSITLWIVSH